MKRILYYTWMLTAAVYDEMDNEEKAEEAYRTLHKLAPKAGIPMEYLKRIDPGAAEKLEKEKAERKKEKGE